MAAPWETKLTKDDEEPSKQPWHGMPGIWEMNEGHYQNHPSSQAQPASQPALTSKTMIIIINDNSDRGGCFCTAERKIQMRMILRMTLQVSVINIYICRRAGICQELIKILSNCPIILFNPFLSFPVPSRSHPVAVLAHLGPVIYEVKLRVSFDVAKLWDGGGEAYRGDTDN